jgi:ABC transport system ATP-binding/permease protein
MTESIVNALMHLFAIIESVKEDDQFDSVQLVIKPYLNRSLNNEELTQAYLDLYNNYLSFHRSQPRSGDEEALLATDVESILQVTKICNQLNQELLQHERIIVFLQLLELIFADGKVTDREEQFLMLVGMNFSIPSKEVNDIKAFVLNKDGKGMDTQRGLVIDNRATEWSDDIAWMMKKKKVAGATEFHHMRVENMFGKMLVLHIASINTFFFRYDGPLNLYVESNKIVKSKSYQLKPGSIIKGKTIKPIYETEITRKFLEDHKRGHIVLTGRNLTFQFKNSDNGIHPFNFSEESGTLVGVMGGSGVGKSTLLNLLNGKIEPTEGRVTLNGFSMENAARYGMIGFVPQDDLLFEELTVYENLFFNAQMCFSEFSKQQLNETVDKVLHELDLYEIRDLRVGDPLNKSISGGQRKRLNIALELLREPALLYVDEPTSGLSSMDSEKVMWLLKDLTRKGKLVIVIIHQPSSDIYKLFDKLWMLDRGGYPIYNGNPIDAVVYFKSESTQVNATESECPHCGNVIPEQILQIVETKTIDDDGRPTSERKIKPSDWFHKYKEKIEPFIPQLRHDTSIPKSNFRLPSSLKQFLIYSKRNVLSKVANKQYILINLLEAPVLAFILGYFSKYSTGIDYNLAENKNLPVYLFMAVVVSLFVGMSVSAEEIFKDRKIIERESFLNLSRFSYINSKVSFLFTLSAFQMLTFVVIGNFILEIHGLSLYYWLLLFSTACFANLVGLTISSAFNSVITIYILIPFILVPQLLLGGAMIKFDDLHKSLTNRVYVPFIGDVMASRWAYEAIAVAQFKENAYEKHFFEAEKKISAASFNISFKIPELEVITNSLMQDENKESESFEARLDILRNELDRLGKKAEMQPFTFASNLTPKSFTDNIGKNVLSYLESLSRAFTIKMEDAANEQEGIYNGLSRKIGKDEILALKKSSFNEALSDILLNRNEIKVLYYGADQLIQKKDPVLMEPESNLGRAHFYAPVKIFLGYRIDTFWFNLMVLWSMTGLLYVLLVKDFFGRAMKGVWRTRLRKE